MPGKVGAPFGNKNKSKDRLIEKALRFELVTNPEDAQWIARKMIDRAKTGDIQAAVFVRDTVDGKPTKRIDVGENLEAALNLIAKDELRTAVRQRMAPFLRNALSGVGGSGGDGPDGNTRIN